MVLERMPPSWEREDLEAAVDELAGELATAENIGFIVRYASGLICVGLPGDRCDALLLPPMVVNNEDPKCTAFTVSIDY